MKETSILKEFTKYSILNILGMIGLSCYIFADTLFISIGLKTEGLTALNLAVPVFSFVQGFGMMIAMGGAIRYSISKGNQDKERQDAVFTQSLYFVLFISVFLIMAGVFLSNELTTLLGADETVHEMANIYLKVILLFSPAFMINSVLICFVRNDGNPKLSMMAMLIGSFSNIILDYIFIFPLNMGILGAVLATGIAPIIGIIVLSWHFIQKKNGFRIRKTKIKLKSFVDISSLGVSSLITEVSWGIVMIVFNTIILQINGNVGVAAYGIVATVSFVITAVFNGISQGIQPIISNNYGAGNKGNIYKVYRYALITAVTIAITIYVASVTLADPIVSIFNEEQNAVLTKIARDGIRIYFIGFVFVGFNSITVTYFSAVSRPKQAFIISLLRGFIVIIPVVWLLSGLLGMNGVWIAMPVTECLVGICAFMLRKQKKI